MPHHRRLRPLLLATVLAAAGCGTRELPPEAPASAKAAAITGSVAKPPPAPAAGVDLGRLGRDDCVRLALRSNRQFLIRHEAMERARQGVTIARSAVYAPQLTAVYVLSNRTDTGTATVRANEPVLGFDVQPFITAGWSQAPGATTGRTEYTSSYGVTVSRRLFGIAEHIRQRLPLSEADRALYAAANAMVIEGKRLQLEATRAFFSLQRSQARATVRERRVADAREFLQLVKDSVAHGFKAPFEELTASINLNQAEADLVSDLAALQESRERLARLLAQPVTAPVGIVAEDLAAAAPAVRPDVERDLVDVKAHHEDLGNQLSAIALEMDRLRVQRDRLAPDITAGFTAENQLTGHRPLDGEVRDERVYSLTLSWADPLDFKASARARYRQLRSEIEEKTLALRDAEDDLEQRLRSSHRRMGQLGSTVSLAQQRLEAERGKMAATMSRWESGAIDNLEVTRAKQDLDNAEIQLLDARIDAVIATAEYRAILPAPTTIDGRAWSDTGRAAPADAAP